MRIMIFIAAFLVAIGILVAVHEFGHYWVAKKLGFKVLRFSIGFGKPLLMRVGRDADRTEYCVAAIPLGGYVKLLDELKKRDFKLVTPELKSDLLKFLDPNAPNSVKKDEGKWRKTLKNLDRLKAS